MSEACVERVWERVWQCRVPRNDIERVLFNHLITSSLHRGKDVPTDELDDHLEQQIRAKQKYMDPSWGYIEAADIGRLLLRSCDKSLSIRR